MIAIYVLFTVLEFVIILETGARHMLAVDTDMITELADTCLVKHMFCSY